MNRTPPPLHSPREAARLDATLRQAQAEGVSTQRNPSFVAFGDAQAPAPASPALILHSDARCTCGTYLCRAEIPHPDRDVDVFPYACAECQKVAYLRGFRAELDQALWDAWVRDPLSMKGYSFR